jgi:hypothetical protein
MIAPAGRMSSDTEAQKDDQRPCTAQGTAMTPSQADVIRLAERHA